MWAAAIATEEGEEECTRACRDAGTESEEARVACVRRANPVYERMALQHAVRPALVYLVYLVYWSLPPWGARLLQAGKEVSLRRHSDAAGAERVRNHERRCTPRGQALQHSLVPPGLGLRV